MATKQEPCARGTIFVGFRTAARELFGEPGLVAIADRLSPEARHDTIERDVLAVEWLPERHVMGWYDAVWNGPAAGSFPAFARFLDRMMDAGFGRIRKVLVGVVSPESMLKKAVDLWHHDHSHGVFQVTISGRTAIASLRDHPYTSTPVSRFATAEIYRYCLSLSRVHTVTMTHKYESEALIVRLSWE